MLCAKVGSPPWPPKDRSTVNSIDLLKHAIEISTVRVALPFAYCTSK
jgi:hypothetical protein